MLHGLGLLVVSAHPRLASKKYAAGALAVGSALFSGSIYMMVLLRSKGVPFAGKILGPVTPLGGNSIAKSQLTIGLIMLGGWAALIV
jgi:uncharacterized membrane protein YgdD (TMEM256/DUF423 family)